MRTALLAFVLLVHAVLAHTARGTTVDDLCSPPGTPQGSKPCACTDTRCEVTGSGLVSTGSFLDFANRDLVVKRRGSLDVGGGSMQIQAPNVTMEGGSALQGVPASGGGGSITVDAMAGDILVSKDAIIDVGGEPAGRVDLVALGNVTIAGAVRAKGTTAEGDGGSVTIDADSIDISGILDYSGQGLGFAGDATLLAVAGFSLAGTVDGSGETGGSLDIDAATGEVRTSAQIRLQATRDGGDGGTVAIVAAGRVLLGGQFRLAGDGRGDGGSGGFLDVDAAGPIEISATLIDLSGGPPTGTGGDVTMTAGGNITVTSSVEVQAQARGSLGSGGVVDLDSEGSVQLPSILAFGGATVFGGSVFAVAWCDLTLPAGRTIDTRGPAGDTTLSAGGQITIPGRLFAGQQNVIEFRDAATPPNLAGGTFNPSPSQVLVPGLIPCGGPLVPGCGNGEINAAAGEECDDGNTDSCDGCSRACQIEGCGNGDLECDEQCDDGNTADCDRCKGDCSRPDNVCGDGITECGEGRDDGNLVACDGASPECRIERCGDEIAECSEECDAGPGGSPACSPQCRIMVPPNCGDGVVQAEDGETCDDENAVDCDGCSSACQLDGCGSGAIEPGCGEECDDFNTRAGDGCSGICQIEACGNGRRDAGEQCDDGNANDCDACRSDCTLPIQPCPICTSGSTEACTACADTTDCDPLRACGASACLAGVCTPVTPPNCDDANPCTTDTCDPTSGCVNAPVVCQDATACDGTLACDPATGQCVSGPAPTCDDGDDCTENVCSEPGATCTYPDRPGIDGADCRLRSLRSLIESATDLPRATRKKLLKQAKSIARKLPKAAGPGRKAEKARRQIANGLRALGRTVARAQRRIDPGTASELNAAITRATVAVGSL